MPHHARENIRVGVVDTLQDDLQITVVCITADNLECFADQPDSIFLWFGWQQFNLEPACLLSVLPVRINM
ncbi:hypothetical protein D3C78_1445090 [compost metagenome]